jgi:hypothetical protein
VSVNSTTELDARTRRANRRLAVVLGLVALGFYLLMFVYNR